MKILHVIISLSTGGAEHLMVDLLPKLRDLGNDVELLVFDGSPTPFYEELAQKGIKIHSLGIGGNVYHPRNMFKLTRFMSGYDIVHTHLSICQLYAPIAKLLKFSRVPLVTTEHSATNRRRSKWYLKCLDKWMYGRYSHIICIANQTYTNLVEYIGQKSNISTIFNGVNVARFLNPIKDISKKDSFIITMAAAFREQKDQDTLIKAMTLLPNNYTLRIVGDGVRRSVLEQLTVELGLENRVSFLGIRSDIPDLLRESDINVLSSHWEGLSLSSIEGMASGRPFIASDVDGLREMVDGYGCLFPHGDYNILAEKIKSLCETPDLYKSIAEKCQERAKEFDIQEMALSYNRVYEELYKPSYSIN